MRISRKYGLIFLANPKCATTTVQRYIDDYTHGDAEEPAGYSCYLDAKGLVEYMAASELSFDDFLVFSTVRNPWDRLVALWRDAKQRPGAIGFDAAQSSATFSDFLRNPTIAVDFARQFRLEGFICAADGRTLVDDVLCVETLETGLALMFRRVGIDFAGLQPRHQRWYRSTDYREYYDDTDRDLVAELFSTDIAYGGYTF